MRLGHVCAVLADAEPWWQPGTRFGYHARTFGFLLGEIIRRAAGRTLMFTGPDQVMGFSTQWPFGYGSGRPSGIPSRPGSTVGMVGMNGSAAYADIDSGVAVAVMRNSFAAGDLTAAARIDRIVANVLS